MIDAERLTALLLDLVRIPSPSRREHEVAARLGAELAALGAEVVVDRAGEAVGGTTGNLVARLRGSVPAPPLLLCAHMDTVVPCEGVRPVLDGPILRTDGTTVLGGDDKAGCAVIIEALRTVREQGIPHGDVEVVFTVCEEVGLLGAKHLDVSTLRARTGLVLDCDGVDALVTRGPAANRLAFRVYGREAHAGVAPETGISAIRVAAEAIAVMRLGRVDQETTANLGVIEGGLATNIVPPRVLVRGEARSLSLERLAAQTAHMRACFEEAAARHAVRVDGCEYRARVEADVERDYDRLDVPADAPIVRLVREAAARQGRTMTVRATGGGCDANVLNGRGLQVANLATAMREIHTVQEWLDLREVAGVAALLVEVLRVNAAESA